MFGNVSPAPDALSAEDKALFRSYYCSLCREIGKRSQPARLGLSYDMTFLALLLCAFEPPRNGKNMRCPMHPTRSIVYLPESKGLCYTADMSVLLIKAKLADDAADEKNPIYKAAKAVISQKRTKYRADFIKTQLDALSQIERERIYDPDLASDAFAVLCAHLFSPEFVPEEAHTPLYWLGYNLGRWIYLIDAYADYERDIKKGAYNPFCGKLDKDSAETEEMFFYTLSGAAAAFDLLPLKSNKSLLENIIYIGLPARQNALLHSTERKIGHEPI